jgi:hypothetical protein
MREEVRRRRRQASVLDDGVEPVAGAEGWPSAAASLLRHRSQALKQIRSNGGKIDRAAVSKMWQSGDAMRRCWRGSSWGIRAAGGAPSSLSRARGTAKTRCAAHWGGSGGGGAAADALEALARAASEAPAGALEVPAGASDGKIRLSGNRCSPVANRRATTDCMLEAIRCTAPRRGQLPRRGRLQAEELEEARAREQWWARGRARGQFRSTRAQEWLARRRRGRRGGGVGHVGHAPRRAAARAPAPSAAAMLPATERPRPRREAPTRCGDSPERSRLLMFDGRRNCQNAQRPQTA